MASTQGQYFARKDPVFGIRLAINGQGILAALKWGILQILLSGTISAVIW